MASSTHYHSGMTGQRYAAEFDQFLRPTEFIDADNPSVRDYATDLVRGVDGDIDRSLALFYSTRSGTTFATRPTESGPATR